jgi:hypothetical protein
MTLFVRISNLSLLLLLGLNSCSKNCDISMTDTDSGDIVPNVVFYPKSGYLTSNLTDYVINQTHPYASCFQVSIDGSDKDTVDYSQYNVIGYPTLASCNASYDRNVAIDNVNQTVTYKIVVTQCKQNDCGMEVLTENYVLVPDFPDTYAVTYDVSFVEK